MTEMQSATITDLWQVASVMLPDTDDSYGQYSPYPGQCQVTSTEIVPLHSLQPCLNECHAAHVMSAALEHLEL